MKKEMPLTELDYHITYALTFHNPPIPSIEVPKDYGACDAIFIGSYKATVDGGVEYGFRGVNEDSAEMEPLQMFQVWMQLARYIKDQLPEGDGPKELCDATIKTYDRAREMAEEGMKKAKKKNGKNKK